MSKHLNRLSTLAQKSLKYGVSALILAVPLYPKFPFIKLPGVAVSIRLEDFVIGIVLLIVFIAVLPKLQEVVSRRITKLAILFVLTGLVSVIAGAIITESIVPHVGLLHWARRIEYLSMFFVGLYSIKRKEDLYFYIRVIFVIIPIVFLYGLGQRYLNIPIITTQNEEYSRGVALRWIAGSHLISTFAGHYDLASFLILVFPTFYLLLTSKKDTLKALMPGTSALVVRVVVLSVTLISIWLLMQTASRTSIVSYLGSSCLALLLMNRKKFIPLIVVVSIVFAALSTNLVDRYMNIINVYAQEETAPPPVEDRSTSIRLNVEWPRAIRALTKNPISGLGYSSITLATDNDYLRMLGETGTVGFIAFFTFLGHVVFQLVKHFPKPSSEKVEDLFVAGLFSAIPGILLNMVFIDILEASKFAILMWLFLGFGYCLTTNAKKIN